MKDINLSARGEVMPPKIDLIALVDADTVVFAAAVSCEYREELLHIDMYTDEELLVIRADPGFDEAEWCVYGINMEEAMAHAEDKLTTILHLSGARVFELHFTAGRESFRYTDVDKDYKANRLADSQGQKTRAPFGLYNLKQALVKKYDTSVMWLRCEADDAVWWLGNQYPDKYLVCAVDKDVLGATRVQAFNYFARAAYIHPKSNNQIAEIKMKFVQAKDPDLFWYYQCLTGDKGDGIIGIHGMGPKKAQKALKGCETNAERWSAIVREYEKSGGSEIDALLNMRMVRLDQYNPETQELNLFTPRDL